MVGFCGSDVVRQAISIRFTLELILGSTRRLHKCYDETSRKRVSLFMTWTSRLLEEVI